MNEKNSYNDIIKEADVVVDADTYEILKSPFKSLTVGVFINFLQTTKMMRRTDLDVAVVETSKERVVSTNFE